MGQGLKEGWHKLQSGKIGKSDSSYEELLDAGLLHGDCMTVTGRRSACIQKLQNPTSTSMWPGQ